MALSVSQLQPILEISKLKLTTKIIISLFSLVAALKAVAVLSTYFMVGSGKFVEANPFSAELFTVYGLGAGLAICFFMVFSVLFIPMLTYFSPLIIAKFAGNDRHDVETITKVMFFPMALIVLVPLVVYVGSDAVHNVVMAISNGQINTWVAGI